MPGNVTGNVPLSGCTRFGLGGPARRLVDAATPEELAAAIDAARSAGEPYTLIGGGSNLVVSDEGFPGTVIRYTNSGLQVDGDVLVVGAGVVLQALVDAAITAGLEGLHTMTRIPGWVGGAIYGNAGAYGHSIQEFITTVHYFDAATAAIHSIDNAACQFRYRESIFKQRKDWIILSASLRLPYAADLAAIRAEADRIAQIRDEKFPPTMKCAGSIFKNLLFAELPATAQAQVPANVVREGKVPSAYFLEQVGAKSMTDGGVQVASYHANLIYNTGSGKSAEVHRLIAILKERVAKAYGVTLAEEVQFI